MLLYVRTDNFEMEFHGDARLGAHLALVHAGVAQLHVLDLQDPVGRAGREAVDAAAVRAAHLLVHHERRAERGAEALVARVRERARREQGGLHEPVHLALPDPRDLLCASPINCSPLQPFRSVITGRLTLGTSN